MIEEKQTKFIYAGKEYSSMDACMFELDMEERRKDMSPTTMEICQQLVWDASFREIDTENCECP